MKTNQNIRGWIVRAVLLTFVVTVLVASTAFGYGNEGTKPSAPLRTNSLLTRPTLSRTSGR